jgi:hypothetical protein
MSLIKTMRDLSFSGMNIELMRYMKCVGAFVNPNDMTRYTHRGRV